MSKNNEKEKVIDFNLTMQQKFNFDSNNFDEEDTKIHKKIQINKKEIESNKRIKKIIKIKNMYKKKYHIALILLIIIFFLFIEGLIILIPIVMENHKISVEKKEEIILDENIVFLGDSITQLYDVNKYYDDYHIVNSGIGGNTTRDIINELDKRVYQYNPSKLFLLIGTNDMVRQYPSDEIFTNIVKIVDEIKKNRPYTKIYVESIYPINNSNDKKISRKSVTYRTNEIVNYVNQKLKEKYKNSNITYIDVNKELLDDNNLLNIEYTVDGVHISDKGYEKITSILLPYIKE